MNHYATALRNISIRNALHNIEAASVLNLINEIEKIQLWSCIQSGNKWQNKPDH